MLANGTTAPFNSESLIQARDQLLTPRFSIRVADIFSAES